MMTNDEMIAVIKAHKAGKQIQFKMEGSHIWQDCADNEPCWAFNSTDYRVKFTPYYRPFKDSEEALTEAIKHGGWRKWNNRYEFMTCITNDDETFKSMLNNYVWADDGTPLGIKVEDED